MENIYTAQRKGIKLSEEEMERRKRMRNKKKFKSDFADQFNQTPKDALKFLERKKTKH